MPEIKTESLEDIIQNISTKVDKDITKDILKFKVEDFKRYLEKVNCEKSATNLLKTILLFFKEKELNPENEKDMYISITSFCIISLKIPDQVFPVKPIEQYQETKDYERNIRENILLAEKCLQLFIAAFCFEFKGEISTSPGSQFQKRLLEKHGGAIIIFIASRIGRHEWTSESLQKLCTDNCDYLINICKAETLTNLLSGVEDNLDVWFRNGMFEKILENLKQYFKTKENWLKCMYIKHAFVWCLTKVKFPFLDHHLNSVVPFLLNIVDDYRIHNKSLAISAFEYVVDNVSPSELNVWNYAALIYEELFKLLYSNDDNIYTTLVPCMNKLVSVLEARYPLESVEYCKWDYFFEKLLNNVEFSNKFTTRRIHLSILPQIISRMGIGSAKHSEHIVNVVAVCLEFTDGKTEQCRVQALILLKETMQQIPVVMCMYENVIVKMFIKLLTDLFVSKSLTCSDQVRESLSTLVVEIFKRLSQHSDSLLQTLKEVTEVQHVSNDFRPVIDCLKLTMT